MPALYKLGFLKINGFKIALIITLTVSSFYLFYGNEFTLLRVIELKSLDWRFRVRGPQKPVENVVIVAIDDYSIENLGRWPWPRSYHADAINRLTTDGAKIIGFDLIFTEPEESPEIYKLRQLRQYYKTLPIATDTFEGIKFGKVLEEALEFSRHDLILAQSISRNNNVGAALVFQSFSNFEGRPPEESKTEDLLNKEHTLEDLPYNLPPEKLPEEEVPIEDLPPSESPGDQIPLEGPSQDSLLIPPEIKKTALKHIIKSDKGRSLDIPVAEELLLPIPELYTNSRCLGHVNFFPDVDGNLRWENTVIEYKGEYYPAFGIQLLKEYLLLKDDDLTLDVDKGIILGDTLIPLDKKGRLFINYYGPANSFRYYSYADLIKGSIPEGTFKDKIVLIGGIATGIGDMWTTPFSQTMPGVEKHATVIANILQKKFLYRDTSALFIDILSILIVGLILGLFLPRLTPIKGTVFVFLIFIIFLILNYSVFYYLKIWLNLVYPVANLVLVSPGIITVRFFAVEREKRAIKRAFKQYLNPILVDELAAHPENLRLGGEKRELTVLFSDIRGFTTFSERYSPEEVVEILNEFLGAMTDVIFRWGGTLDKFIGDAIIAFWGAPLKQEDHAELAVKCALNMIQRLFELRQKWQAEGKAPLDIGIGINTGEMLVGNIGADGKRMDYTVIGDNVNIGARTESLTRRYNTHILITEFTLNKIRDAITQSKIAHVYIKGLEKVIVKGKEKHLVIYEVKSLKHDSESLIIESEDDKIFYQKEK